MRLSQCPTIDFIFSSLTPGQSNTLSPDQFSHVSSETPEGYDCIFPSVWGLLRVPGCVFYSLRRVSSGQSYICSLHVGSLQGQTAFSLRPETPKSWIVLPFILGLCGYASTPLGPKSGLCLTDNILRHTSLTYSFPRGPTALQRLQGPAGCTPSFPRSPAGSVRHATSFTTKVHTGSRVASSRLHA